MWISRSLSHPRNYLAFPFQPQSQIQDQGAHPEGNLHPCWSLGWSRECSTWGWIRKDKPHSKGTREQQSGFAPALGVTSVISMIFMDHSRLLFNAPLVLLGFMVFPPSLGGNSQGFMVLNHIPNSWMFWGIWNSWEQSRDLWPLKFKLLEILRDPKSKSLGRNSQGFMIQKPKYLEVLRDPKSPGRSIQGFLLLNHIPNSMKFWWLLDPIPDPLQPWECRFLPPFVLLEKGFGKSWERDPISIDRVPSAGGLFAREKPGKIPPGKIWGCPSNMGKSSDTIRSWQEFPSALPGAGSELMDFFWSILNPAHPNPGNSLLPGTLRITLSLK